MISIIICSINKILIAELELNISNTIGVEHEIIIINNKENRFSISQAYNHGAGQSKYDNICFIHEDILFHTKNWGINLIKHLKNNEISIIGVFGCTVKTIFPSGVYSAIEKLNRVNQFQVHSLQLVKCYYNPYQESFSPVATVDGMFIACTKENWRKAKFDESLPTKYHGYDVDFSIAQQKNGAVVIIYDILIQHSSTGTYSQEWLFSQIYIAEKWKSILPIIKEKNVPLRVLENSDINVFLSHLYHNNYLPKLSRNLTIKILLRKPFQKLNLFFLKRYIFSLLNIHSKFKQT